MMLLPLDPLFSFIIGRRCVMDIKGYCTFIHLVGRLLMRKVMTDEAGNLWGYNIRGTRESYEQVYFFKDGIRETKGLIVIKWLIRYSKLKLRF